MPVTHLTPADAADVASWLLAQPAMDEGAGWKDLTVAEADVTKLEDLAKVYLVRQLTKTNLKNFFDNKKLDDELVADLPTDEKTFIKEYSTKGKHALEMYVGKKGVSRQGCFGCHDIPGYETAKPIGVGLNDWGKKDGSRLAFEDIDNFLEDHFYNVESLVDPDTHKPYGPKEVKEGEGEHAKKIVKLPYEKFFKDATEERFREGYLNQKLLDPRSYDYNRIRAWDDRARMPQFKFARLRKKAGESTADFEARQMKEEAEAREAVMTFILGLVGEAAPDKMQNIPKGDRLAEVKGRQVLENFNCGGCHLIRPGEFKLKYNNALKVLESSAKVDRKADQTFPNHHYWTGTPQANADYVMVHGLVPQPLPVSDDEDEEPKVRLRTMEAVRFQGPDKATHDIPSATLLSLEPKDFVLPAWVAGGSAGRDRQVPGEPQLRRHVRQPARRLPGEERREEVHEGPRFGRFEPGPAVRAAVPRGPRREGEPRLGLQLRPRSVPGPQDDAAPDAEVQPVAGGCPGRGRLLRRRRADPQSEHRPHLPLRARRRERRLSQGEVGRVRGPSQGDEPRQGNAVRAPDQGADAGVEVRARRLREAEEGRRIELRQARSEAQGGDEQGEGRQGGPRRGQEEQEGRGGGPEEVRRGEVGPRRRDPALGRLGSRDQRLDRQDRRK